MQTEKLQLTPEGADAGARASGVGAIKADAEAQKAAATARDFTMVLSVRELKLGGGSVERERTEDRIAQETDGQQQKKDGEIFR